jgi:hypothetical protein
MHPPNAAYVTHFQYHSTQDPMVHSLPRPLHPLFIYPVHVTHNDARCLPSPFSHSQFASTYVVYRSSPTRLHTHESLLDGPYISPPHSPHHHLPLSSSLFFLFLNSFHALANLTTLPPPPLFIFQPSNLPLPASRPPSFPRVPPPPCLSISVPVLSCFFILSACHNYPYRVPPVHSAITLNKGSDELAA